MFDWNDQELTNIIWGETGESDDPIVPYPDSSEGYCKKKEWVQESSIIISSEQKAPGPESDLPAKSLDGGSNFEPGEGTSSSGIQLDTWSNASKSDHDSLGKPVSANLTQTYKFDSRAETAQMDKDSGVFQTPSGGKNQDDSVDYGWDGSFDDLDQIFSTDDPIFGNVNLCNDDEIWSSKGITNSQVKSFVDSPSLGLEGALRDGSENFDIKGEYMQEDDQAFTLDYGNDNDTMSHNLQSACATLDHFGYTGGERKNVVKDQKDQNAVGKESMPSCIISTQKVGPHKPSVDESYKQNKLSKARKKHEEKNNLKWHQDLYGNWSSFGPSGDPYSPQAMQSSPSSVINQERQLHGTEPLFYQHISNTFVPPSTYGNIANPFSSMPMLPGYEVLSENAKPADKTTDSTTKYPTLTPQEKIEKLRRRQQIQAMVAIRKQQQQFGRNLDAEDPGALPTFDTNSPGKQDDSTDCSAEDTILLRLQEVVAKLDFRVRLCIRDSLYRLAQSATQRHSASDTNSTNDSTRDDHSVLKEDNSDRNVKLPEVETESNPIDRTVAHLLFRRPMELSGKPTDTPESSSSAKLKSEPRMARIRHGFSLEGFQSSASYSDTQPSDDVREVEASQRSTI